MKTRATLANLFLRDFDFNEDIMDCFLETAPGLLSKFLFRLNTANVKQLPLVRPFPLVKPLLNLNLLPLVKPLPFTNPLLVTNPLPLVKPLPLTNPKLVTNPLPLVKPVPKHLCRPERMCRPWAIECSRKSRRPCCPLRRAECPPASPGACPPAGPADPSRP